MGTALMTSFAPGMLWQLPPRLPHSRVPPCLRALKPSPRLRPHRAEGTFHCCCRQLRGSQLRFPWLMLQPREVPATVKLVAKITLPLRPLRPVARSAMVLAGRYLWQSRPFSADFRLVEVANRLARQGQEPLECMVGGVLWPSCRPRCCLTFPASPGCLHIAPTGFWWAMLDGDFPSPLSMESLHFRKPRIASSVVAAPAIVGVTSPCVAHGARSQA